MINVLKDSMHVRIKNVIKTQAYVVVKKGNM